VTTRNKTKIKGLLEKVIAMPEALTTYLHDHLGGAEIALQILDTMHNRHDDAKFREFASTLLPEIQADDRTLRSIAEKTGASPSTIKQAGGWLLEKAARLKLGHAGSTDFELFESLELLALGIQGKLCLWKALGAVSMLDSRLREYDFGELANRARRQYDQVESHRLYLAQTIFVA
jgi:hypothetical protein